MSIPPEPKPVIVVIKKEKGEDAKPSEPPPIPPWATRVVTVKKEDPGKQDAVPGITIVPARPPSSAPWVVPDFVPVMPRDIESARQRELPPIPEPQAQRDEAEAPHRSRKQRRKPAKHSPEPPPRMWGENVSSMLCVKNYEAVDPSREVYGLINQGLSDTGTRTLIMHVRRGQVPWVVFGGVRPGGVLPVIAKSGRGGTTSLRVRFTTPAKYYSPGRKVTSMTIGVDEMDWQSLMTKAHRI